MPLKEAPLATFHGDESFPIEWSSETERDLFWVFDDLHCPQPLSPMYEDIGGWWLTCDHMFRRFGTPFASDWIAKNINGYLYTAAIPAEAEASRSRPRSTATRSTRSFPRTGTTRARSAPTWRRAPGLRRGVRRLVAGPPRPRDAAQLRLPRGGARRRQRDEPRPDSPSCSRTPSTSTTATGRSTGCSTSRSSARRQNLQAVMQRRTAGSTTPLLGRLQNSASDRNWDKIRGPVGR